MNLFRIEFAAGGHSPSLACAQPAAQFAEPTYFASGKGEAWEKQKPPHRVVYQAFDFRWNGFSGILHSLVRLGYCQSLQATNSRGGDNSDAIKSPLLQGWKTCKRQ